MKRKWIAIGFCLFCACAAACVICASKSSDSHTAIPVYPDAYSREYYLNLCGWEVTLLSETEVTIPAEWSEQYAGYAALQELQGFPLSAHKGKAALLCTYAVENYGGAFPVRAELLICEDQIAAGSLYALSGEFQCGLRGETIT